MDDTKLEFCNNLRRQIGSVEELLDDYTSKVIKADKETKYFDEHFIRFLNDMKIDYLKSKLERLKKEFEEA